ncbi:MAG: fibronectin type III domain-containing protein [Deltaproteobacteria bacterium]|nr:fibronectin type III domain-containing protein [Deltaproteobacteria bacterium]
MHFKFPIVHGLCLFLFSPAYAQVKISEPAIGDIRANQATIEWTTEGTSTGTLLYGPTQKLGSALSSPSSAEGHTLTLKNLKPATGYYFKILAKDIHGKASESLLYSFKTESLEETPDTLLKLINPPQVFVLSPYKVTISWETNKSASSMATYGTQGLKPKRYIGNVDTKAHIISLEDLTPNTRYYYQVKSEDETHHIVTSSYASFVTQKETSQKPLPPTVLEGPVIAVRAADQIKIEWTTDRPCKSHLMWGKVPLPSFLTKKMISEKFTRNHTVILENLSKGTRYYYVIHLEDRNKHKSVSEIYSVITEALD